MSIKKGFTVNNCCAVVESLNTVTKRIIITYNNNIIPMNVKAYHSYISKTNVYYKYYNVIESPISTVSTNNKAFCKHYNQLNICGPLPMKI